VKISRERFHDERPLRSRDGTSRGGTMCTGAGGAEWCLFRAARFRAGLAHPVRRGLSEIPYLRPLEVLTDSTLSFW